ncbi:hypothetical protein BDW62DRAFT_198579 [Aspergillus aurantiobrunneus]
MATRNTLLSIFNHVVLPPELPGESNPQGEPVDREMLRRLLDAVTIMKNKSQDDLFPVWQRIEDTLKASSLANEGGICNKSALVRLFGKLSPENALLVRVREQNAGLLIRKESAGKASVIFEAFEMSPSAEKTIAAKGALQWDFPGTAASIPYTVFKNPNFQESLAAFLEKASTEHLDQFAVKVRKAGAEVSEDRNTSDPAIITQFLMTLLEANGERLLLPVLRKRVSDDVCWDNAKLPWRRSPFWLALRVCVQRLLYLHLGPNHGRIEYKALMCLFLAKLLDDCVISLDSGRYQLLKVKLCRRLAKLDSEKEALSTTRLAAHAYTHVLEEIESYCAKSIDTATAAIENEWNAWKQDTQRRVPKLPPRASPDDFKLTLPSSIEYFREIFRPQLHHSARAVMVEPSILGDIAARTTSQQFATLTEAYSSLAAREAAIESNTFEVPSTVEAINKRCIDLACLITDYISVVGNAYDGDPEQMSLFILSIFDMWVDMDRCCVAEIPLLKDYHPWFSPEILDVLLLARWKDLRRLQAIQNYLHSRCTQAKQGKMTLFADPAAGCFSDRYFDLPGADELQKLRRRILDASQESEDYKADELVEVNNNFGDLTEKLRLSSCTMLRNLDGTHDIRGCKHCFYMRSRRRLGIEVHEDFLPRGDMVQQRAVLFELNPPKALAAYREATWSIVNRLCSEMGPSDNAKPEMLLAEYSQLNVYNYAQKHACCSLASHTKSFLGTHYSWRRLPATVENVLLPHGLRYSYYDSKRGLWFSDYPEKLNFAHHFAIDIPKESPFSSLYSSPGFAADAEGPSSYEVAASISECPSELTIHEWTAHQTMVGGKNRRWLSVLTELGSSNMNLSLQETMVLFHHLALQAGPRLEQDSMRAVHVVFRDPRFCSRLTEQVSRHVEAIATNWRETNYMETLLTLCLRLFALGPAESRHDSKRLLLRIRQITLTWITLLRNETRNAEDVGQSDRAARYCFLSALLCRRTFYPWISSQLSLDSESLKCFFDASLAMQESLVADLGRFSRTTRNMLIRDIKMVARMSSLLRASAMQNPRTIGVAIDTAWPEADKKQRPYQDWKFLSSPYDNWATSTTTKSENTRSQIFYFHILEGHVVVDGQTMGKLPADIRDSNILKELFGNQRLFALPSGLLGNDYVLSNCAEGHRIHLGYRNKRLIIQAEAYGSILELVPRGVFGIGPAFDLPFGLISDCIHWIDLRTGILEIRQKPRIWRRREGNWTVDIRARKAHRRESSLIDPYSQLAQVISQIFLHFEHPSRLTIFQTPGNLVVELKRMNLDFNVTTWGQLKCRQLGAVIDRDQDPGTFYGLQSMLVLRDLDDRTQRSIIVSLGKPVYRRHRSHVLVDLESKGIYVKYTINTLLRRLECPADPRLLYTKAQLHALTSHPLPDPLTGRTGTQEALDCLQSGYCQPWIPLASSDLRDTLVEIANLTPQREYYPKDKQCQQTVSWDPHLTANIQHEGFYSVVDAIIKRSDRLSQFSPDTTHTYSEKSTIATRSNHLLERAQWRRSIFEPSDTLCLQPIQPEDVHYVSRDGWCTSKRTNNVREVVALLRKQPPSIHTTRDLMGLFGSWPSIGGYTNTFNLYNLSDSLDADLAEQWGGLVNMCRESKKEDVHHLMFELGVIAFRDKINMTALRVIMSFFILRELQSLALPRYPSFAGFREDEKPTTEVLLPIIRISYQLPRPTKVPKKRKGSVSDENARLGYGVDCEKEGVELAKMLIRQWPCEKPSVEGFESRYLDITEAMDALLPEWKRMYCNAQLQRHVTEVQTVLNRHYATAHDQSTPSISPNRAQKEILGPRPRHNFYYPRLGEDLLRKEVLKLPKTPVAAVENASVPEVKEHPASASPKSDVLQAPSPEIIELEAIVSKLGQSDCSVRSRYAQDLEKSIIALKAVAQSPGIGHARINPGKEKAKLDDDIKAARAKIDTDYRSITESLSAHDKKFVWLSKGNLWPALTPTTILKQLRSTSRHDTGPGMNDLLISYAVAITKLQKLLRLKGAAAKREESRLKQESTDPGHVNWNPSDFPDWILLEIDANIQIRQEQVTVALEMISPTSGSNSVLQMNMGQGKTSVIMPMVSAVLADGTLLNRLLVPKALLSQAAQILQSRLGGLLGRDIIHVPFSRRTRTTVPLIQEYHKLHSDMMQASGIILGVPEHILSFKLSGLQRLADSKLTEAVAIIETQKWMDEVCRDVLDECDFTLAVKTQLIYPGGSQLVVDGHPDRWDVAMAVLGLVEHHLKDLAREYPQSIDILQRNSTGFPVIYLLRKDVEEALVRKIADDICKKRTSLLPLADCNEKAKEAIGLFITQDKVDKSVAKRVSKLFPDTPKARKVVYLLRGLLVHGILILCLKKRWNVQYGLHHGRDPIAVPCHAKGVPSDQAEWGQPDVSILFTCLAFYYEGLSQQQLKRSLEAVLKSDHPATEYDRWTQNSALPEALRHWNAITVDDAGLVSEIWKHLRYTRVVINYFLSHFVFPLHAKQFATKLQGSGWDVLLYNNSPYRSVEDTRIHPGITTGFSGTNDNRRLLPLTIEQCDLQGLSRTNAEVLTYLLQARNRRYRVATGVNGRRLSEVGLLDYLHHHNIRILIDAGAFIMEMDNASVARAWIQADWTAKGAVYFAEDNKPWVMYRNLKRVPLLASPFADDMRDCVVYLDESNTRGVDLKLPVNAVGALTLGLSQTKDHTVQAAMRLRQLGTTQAVTFIAPPEVHQSILDVCNKTSRDNLDSSDVVTWLLDQTCATNRELQPLYFAQGRDFCHRMQAAATYKKFLSSLDQRKAYLAVLQQPEQQTLEQLYEPIYGEAMISSPESGTASGGRVAELMKALQQRRQESQSFGSVISSALEEVEQEREVAYEIEEEREIAAPRKPKAIKFPGIAQSVLDFAKWGLIGNGNILAASKMLESTHLGEKFKIEGSSLVPRLYVSAEFIRTIKQKKSAPDDTYMRPVNWILYNTVRETALVIIPEEAEQLIPMMRASLSLNTHLLLYAAPWTKSMLHFNTLLYYSLPDLPAGWTPPSWLPFELGILAGRLYFPFSEYEDLLGRLYSLSGVSDKEKESSNLLAIAKNRLNFLQEWLAIRRQGQDITDTPLGYVCHDWPLRSDHPFFSSKTVKPEGDNGPGLESLRFNVPDEEEEYYSSDDEMGADMMGVDGDEVPEEDVDVEWRAEREPTGG